MRCLQTKSRLRATVESKSNSALTIPAVHLEQPAACSAMASLAAAPTKTECAAWTEVAAALPPTHVTSRTIAVFRGMTVSLLAISLCLFVCVCVCTFVCLFVCLFVLSRSKLVKCMNL